MVIGQLASEEPRHLLHRELAHRVVRRRRHRRVFGQRAWRRVRIDGGGARRARRAAGRTSSRGKRLQQVQRAVEVDAIDRVHIRMPRECESPPGARPRRARRRARRRQGSPDRAGRPRLRPRPRRRDPRRYRYAQSALAQLRAQVPAGEPGGAGDQNPVSARRHGRPGRGRPRPSSGTATSSGVRAAPAERPRCLRRVAEKHDPLRPADRNRD